MRHEEGINIAIHRLGGQQIEEYSNPLVKRGDLLTSFLGSSFVCVPPSAPFEITVEFEESFELHGADGVLVSLALAPKTFGLCDNAHNQCFWLDKNQMEIQGMHKISKFTMWESATKNDQVNLPMPSVDRKYTVGSTEWCKLGHWAYDAFSGCFTITVERGHLNVRRDLTRKYVWSVNDPPVSSLRTRQSTPKVVRGQWFERLGDDKHGACYRAEYRNITNSRIQDIHSRLATETLRSPTASEIFSRNIDRSNRKRVSETTEPSSSPTRKSTRKRRPTSRSQATTQAPKALAASRRDMGEEEPEPEEDLYGVSDGENQSPVPPAASPVHESKRVFRTPTSMCSTIPAVIDLTGEEKGEEEDAFIKEESILDHVSRTETQKDEQEITSSHLSQAEVRRDEQCDEEDVDEVIALEEKLLVAQLKVELREARKRRAERERSNTEAV